MVATFLLLYVIAELANGYTYIPAKRGGFMVSGIPTLLIALSAFSLCTAAALTFIDHYDKRNNENTYIKTKKFLYSWSWKLFVAAPIIELVEWFLTISGVDVFPKFHGFADRYTFYSPSMQNFLIYVKPVEDIGLYIIGTSFGLISIGLLIKKLSSDGCKKLVFSLMCAGMLGLSFFGLTLSTKEFLMGKASYGRHHHAVVSATADPSKFNAVLLTNFILGGFMFTLSGVGLVGICTNRIKNV